MKLYVGNIIVDVGVKEVVRAILDLHCWRWCQVVYACDYNNNFRYRKILREMKGLEPIIVSKPLIEVKKRKA